MKFFQVSGNKPPNPALTSLVLASLGLTLIAPSAHAASYNVLYRFNGSPDGYAAYGGALLLNQKTGNITGTTAGGGTNDFGTIFSLNTSGQETILYNFNNGSKGGNPNPGLIKYKGELYGTVFSGVSGTGGGAGGIFKVSRRNKVSKVYGFCSLSGCADGEYPLYGVIADNQGNLYGTTQEGGAYNQGVVFEVNPEGQETVLHSFCAGGGSCSDGALPTGGLVRDQVGNVYGTTQGGGGVGTGFGTVFKIDTSGTFSTLYSFGGLANGDGSRPYGTPTLDAGNLYGTTNEGGTGTLCGDSRGCGIVYKISSTGKEAVLHSFSASGATDGANPLFNGLVLENGNLYGTTQLGGTYGWGTVFQLTLKTHVETPVYNFTGGADGLASEIGLIKDSAGNLYGEAEFGGNSCANQSLGCGAVFKVTP